MKKLLLLAITGMFLVSCGGGGDEWSNSDKTEFKNLMKQEIAGTPLYEEADAFCNCLLDAAMGKWSSLDDMDNDSFTDGYDWGFEQGMKCAEKLGFEF